MPRLPRPIGMILTFGFVSVAWVPFRAADMTAAGRVLAGLFGGNGIPLPASLGWVPGALAGAPFGNMDRITVTVLLPAALLWVWALPNSQEWLRHARVGLPTAGYPTTVIVPEAGGPAWTPAWRTAIATAAALALAFTLVSNETTFIYFQF